MNARKEARRAAAQERDKIHQALTVDEKIKKCQERPGASAREIKRLQKLLQ